MNATQFLSQRVHLRLALWALASAIILGGSSRSAPLANLALQLATLPVLLFALNAIFQAQVPKRLKLATAVCGLLALVPLCQLLPLPPTVWTALTGRSHTIDMFAMLGQPVGWMPLSVSPSATQLAVVCLIPTFAVFLITLLLDRAERRTMTLALLALGVLSIGLGIIQVAQGPATRLRFFDFTNPMEAVGFFANRNHFAALLYVVLVFAEVWIVQATLAPSKEDASNRLSALPQRIGWSVLIIVLILAQVSTRSRAGFILTLAASAGAFALAISDKRAVSSAVSIKWSIGAVLIAILSSGEYVIFRLMERFASDPLGDARLVFAKGTTQAALLFMPFGSGLSTFVPVYASFETPAMTIPYIYANQAHNEYLQLWLETGVVGPVLLALAVVWFGVKVRHLWARPQTGLLELDLNIMRAASLAISLLLAHSFVDYPLRTAAMMSVMAFCCALLIAPPLEASAIDSAAVDQSRQTGSRLPAHQPAGPLSERTTQPIDGTAGPKSRLAWGDGGTIEWPDAWKNKPSPPGPAAPRMQQSEIGLPKDKPESRPPKIPEEP